ncbi:MAG: exo-beta-N-acetylmuramidase NamZ family protein [Bacteriovoracaceae bacterium]
MAQTLSGLDHLINKNELLKKIPGNIGYLCHSASVTKDIEHGAACMKRLFGDRFKKIFGPQHGFVTDVQDNMVETKDFIHPFFKVVVHSLYSETRIPTDHMLSGLDCIVVDLQDVGTRIYTYIYTLTLLMEACGKKGIKVVVLDRPNPINGIDLEGNILDTKFASFVGRHPLPVRHGLTMGEVGLMAKKFWNVTCDYEIIPMVNWKREMSYEDTNLPWVIPSPNLPTIEAAYTFVGTVLYEGTNISEGRGTTRSLEIVGHPKIEAFSMHSKIMDECNKNNLKGFVLRPLVFLPTFQKHLGLACGGYQIHVTDRKTFKPWRLCQLLCQIFYHELGKDFIWKIPPYEYEYEKMPIDLINGTDVLRHWVEKREKFTFLDELEAEGMPEFLQQRKECLIY